MTSVGKYVTVFLLPFPQDPPLDLIRERFYDRIVCNENCTVKKKNPSEKVPL